MALRFQRDEHPPVVERRCPGGADLGADRRDCWIFQDYIYDGFHSAFHRGEGDGLGRFRNCDDHSGVLLGKEAFRNDHVEIAGDADCAQHHHQRDKAMPQRDFEAALIEVEQPIEAALSQAVQAPMPFRIFVSQQPRAHHRRQRQRDDHRQDQRYADRHREFAEQQTDIAAHQEERNEHGNQRQRDRGNREADLAGALERSLRRVHPLFEVAVHVLDDDDSIVDDEANRDRQRHQRQIVEAVAELVEHPKGADQRQRHGDGRDNRRPKIPQEQKDHHDDQCDAEQQRELHVADRGADRLRAIGQDRYFDRRRDRGFELR